MLPWSRLFCTLIAFAVLSLRGAFGQGSAGEDRRLAQLSYSVSQTHSLKVRQDSLIDVALSIVFHVAPGKVLSGSGKTILSDLGIQNLEGPVTATDASGRSLVLRTSSNSEGWFKVDFDFAEPVDGTVTPDYTVNLAYTVSNGICVPSSGRARFDLPWAHRWLARVLTSRYEIAFADPRIDMRSVCLGTTSFRPRCGPSGLTVSGTNAVHEVAGTLHGIYFDWSATDVSLRTCSGAAAQTVVQTPPSLQAAAADEPESNSEILAEEEPPMAAMTVGIVAAGSSVLFAGAVCVYARRGRARKNSSADLPSKKKSKLELDLEGASDSTGCDDHGRSFSDAQSSLSEFQTSYLQPAVLNFAVEGGSSQQIRRGLPEDAGAGLGAWDVLDEFEEEELEALNQRSFPEYSVQVSEHRPDVSGFEKVSYGKPSSHHDGGSSPSSPGRLRRDHAVEMAAVELELFSDTYSAVDPFAVQDDFDDHVVEDNLVHASASNAPAVPTMAVLPKGATGHELSENTDSLRSAAQMQAREAALAAAPPALSDVWEALDEFDGEDVMAHYGHASPRMQIMGPEAMCASPRMEIMGAQAMCSSDALVVPPGSPAASSCKSWVAMSEFDAEEPHGEPNATIEVHATCNAETLSMKAAGLSMMQNFLLPPAPSPRDGSSSLKAATVPSRCPEDAFLLMPMTAANGAAGHSYAKDQSPLPRMPPAVPGNLPADGGLYRLEAHALPPLPAYSSAPSSGSQTPYWQNWEAMDDADS